MKMKCVFRCIVNGDLVKPGQVIDVAEVKTKTEPFLHSFVPIVKPDLSAGKPAEGQGSQEPPDGSANQDQGDGQENQHHENTTHDEQKLVAGLTREQAIAKLRAAKVNVPGNISDNKLIERFEETFSTDAN